MQAELAKKIIFEIAGFSFYLFEIFRFFHQEPIVIPGQNDFLIFYIKILFLFFALPLLYIFRIASFLGWEDVFSYFLSASFKTDNKSNYFQIKLFYNSVYVIYTILLFFELLGAK